MHTLTLIPRSWATAAVDVIRGVFTRPAAGLLPYRVLDVLDEASGVVYEDAETYRSYTVDLRGVVTEVSAEIDRLQAEGCVVAGDLYGPTGRQRRDWLITARGAVVLAEMWHSRGAAALEAAELWNETKAGAW